jgi:hypothetical protein
MGGYWLDSAATLWPESPLLSFVHIVRRGSIDIIVSPNQLIGVCFLEFLAPLLMSWNIRCGHRSRANRLHISVQEPRASTRRCSPAPRSALLTLFQAFRYDRRQAPKQRRLTGSCRKTEWGEARKAMLGDAPLWLAFHTKEHRLARVDHPPTSATHVTARHDCHRTWGHRVASQLRPLPAV